MKTITVIPHTTMLCCDRANLELFEAQDVMAHPVRSIRATETVGALCRELLSHSHGGIPVVKYDETTRHEVAYGLITRYTCILLTGC